MLLQEYLRIDTSNPPGNEIAAAEFFHRLFDEAGIPNSIYPYASGRANLYARLKGDGSLRPLVLLNHTDVVQSGPKQWRVPPFSGEIVDNELYGRGAVDMKDEGMIQAMVMLMAAKERLPLKRDLIFLAVADEEVESTGSAWMIENHPELLRGAEYLITEGGSNLIQPDGVAVYGIGVGEKAPLWLRLVAAGRGGHGSMPIADSAPNRLARALQRIVDWQTPMRLLPSVEEYFRESARLEPEPRAEMFRDVRKNLGNAAFAESLAGNRTYNFMLRDTISLTRMEAGNQTNVIPATATAELDVRLLPGSDPQAFLNQLRTIIADKNISIEPIKPFQEAGSSPTDSTLYRIIRQTVLAQRPRAIVTPALNPGSTESRMYRPLGIHCYGFGPVEVSPEIYATQHAANERIPVEQIRRGVKLLCEIVARAVNEP
jgi:acetylornithine deacetylase/succinyl-diaminopimelate desuccinylase-like protein